MKKLLVMIDIHNKVFLQQITHVVRLVEESDLREEVKNNFMIAGESLIDVIKEFDDNDKILSLSILRNIFEMTSLGIVLDIDNKIKSKYDSLKDIKNADVRRLIKESEGDYILGNEELIQMGIKLEYDFARKLYHYLCNYSHAGKINEISECAQRNESISSVYKKCILLFTIYPLVYIYMDSVCNKLKGIEMLREFATVYIINISKMYKDFLTNNEEIQKLNQYLSSKFGDNIAIYTKINNEKNETEKIIQNAHLNGEFDINSIDFKEINRIYEKMFSKEQLIEIINFLNDANVSGEKNEQEK